MAVTVGAVMRECKNYFERGFGDGEHTIAEGSLQPNDSLTAGAWVAIKGSAFHDGVFRLGGGGTLEGLPEGLPDETFVGRVWTLGPPADFLALCDEIAAFDRKTPVSGLASESFGQYSRTMVTGRDGAVLHWQSAYAQRLATWRRMFTEVRA